MTKPLFELHATHNPHRWYLPVVPEICVGRPDRKFLFGGIGLAAAISALEQTCRRPVIWATAHYLSFARPGSIVDLDVWVPVEGNQTTQASVLAHVEDKRIISVNAALGARDSEYSDQWVKAPAVPPPDDCAPVISWRAQAEGLQGRFDIRLASGRFPDGRDISGRSDQGNLTFWMRSRDGHRSDPLTLAVMGDFVSVAIGNAIGRHAGGNSLDNTIRFAHQADSEWVLCDIQVETINAGVVHGAMHLFSEKGALLAIASQSLILRLHPNPGEPDQK